jgi:hypothetical protein
MIGRLLLFTLSSMNTSQNKHLTLFFFPLVNFILLMNNQSLIPIHCFFRLVSDQKHSHRHTRRCRCRILSKDEHEENEKKTVQSKALLSNEKSTLNVQLKFIRIDSNPMSLLWH